MDIMITISLTINIILLFLIASMMYITWDVQRNVKGIIKYVPSAFNDVYKSIATLTNTLEDLLANWEKQMQMLYMQQQMHPRMFRPQSGETLDDLINQLRENGFDAVEINDDSEEAPTIYKTRDGRYVAKSLEDLINQIKKAEGSDSENDNWNDIQKLFDEENLEED